MRSHVSSAQASRRHRRGGYALLDVILAVTVFAFWGVGLITLLQKISDTSNSYSRDRLIQYQLESLLTEMKHRPVNEMNTERFDEALEVTYRTVVEPLNAANLAGDTLEDLYEITATAVFNDAGGEQIETAKLTVYQPEEKGR
ncbi:MAG: hypothetical protein KDN20_16975 [Verrucomicrobiae bacterium]|nr:hypothetical protein [Verrucomicrobiae bacterium]